MLRKAVTVIGLFGTIALLGLLHQPSPDAFNAEAMAVFGFIVLAAFMLGDLAESIHLPHITGYLLTGIICGPYVLGLLDKAVIQDLKLFDHLAVALIALSAGAALTIQTLKKGARLLSAVMISQFFFSLLLVGGVVILCSGIIPGFALPFLVDATWGFKLAAALCLGLVASAMSPAATIAIVHETKSKGPITDAVMGISILNNVIVVAGLSVVRIWAFDRGDLGARGFHLQYRTFSHDHLGDQYWRRSDFGLCAGHRFVLLHPVSRTRVAAYSHWFELHSDLGGAANRHRFGAFFYRSRLCSAQCLPLGRAQP